MSYVFNIPFRKNSKLKQMITSVQQDHMLNSFWKCSNIMAIDRMGYTDHGPTHVKIVANLAFMAPWLTRRLIDGVLLRKAVSPEAIPLSASPLQAKAG